MVLFVGSVLVHDDVDHHGHYPWVTQTLRELGVTGMHSYSQNPLKDQER